MRYCRRALLTLLYIEHIEQESNSDDEFTEDSCTFLISYFLSTFDIFFRGFNNNH